eukprot:gene5216-5592_t
MLLNAVIYLSEAKNAIHIENCLQFCRSQRYPLIHWFKDEVYNRSSFYFATSMKHEQAKEEFIYQLLSVCRFGHNCISFQNHVGLHPTLGSIDHISFSPLFPKDHPNENHRNYFLHQCDDIAKRFAELYYNDFRIPVYLYGPIADKQKLQDIRRSLGYFQATSNNVLAHSIQDKIKENAAGIYPSFGAWQDYHPDRGVTCIGSVPLIQNYNIRIRPTASYWTRDKKLSDVKASIAQITKQLRSSTVEALTLPYANTNEKSNVYEIACNLLNPYPPEGTTSHQVYEQVQTLAKEKDLEIIADYSTNPLESELIEKYNQYEKERDQ